MGTAAFQGMNTQQAQQLAENLRTAGQEWETKADTASLLLAGVVWSGDDAAQYRTRVTSTTLPALQHAGAALTKFALLLEQQLAAQNATSNAIIGGSWASGPDAPSDTGIDPIAQIFSFFSRPRGVPIPMGDPVKKEGPERSIHLAKIGAMGGYAAATKYFGIPQNVPTEQDATTIIDVQDHGPGQTADAYSGLVLDLEEARVFNGGGPDRENVRIQQIQTASGDTAYVVFIPPTAGGLENRSAWDQSQGNSRDWAANPSLMSGVDTSSKKNVIKAMEKFGVPKGAPVMLVGHSQGGLIAASIASDPDLNGPKGWHFSDGFTMGAPVNSFTPAQTNTEITNVSHKEKLLEISYEFSWKKGALFPDMSLRLSPDLDIDFDPVAITDAGGYQLGTTDPVLGVSVPYIAKPENPQVTEVTLESHDVVTDPHDFGGTIQKKLAVNHDTLRIKPDGTIDPDYGYQPSIDRAEETNPELKAAWERVDGIYAGEGTQVMRDQTITFSRN